MGKIITVSPEGVVTVENSQSPPSLGYIQEKIGGGLDMLGWANLNIRYRGVKSQFYVDDEGLLKGLPVNAKASRIVQTDVWNGGRPIVGTMVILTGSARWLY